MIAQFPYADQRADGCQDTGHCSHATLLMAAATINPSALQQIPECAGPISAVIPRLCVKAAQDKVEYDPSRTDIPNPLNRGNCGSVKTNGALTRDCGCALSADTSVNLAKSLFGMKAAVLNNRDSPSDSDADARAFTRTNLKNVLHAGCVAGINVQAQTLASAESQVMKDNADNPIYRGGHWMLLIDEVENVDGVATSYVVNDPFDAASSPGRTYTAESVLNLVVNWNRDVRGKANAILAFCPTDGPRLLVNEFTFPSLALNKPTAGFRLHSDPEGASFKLESGTLPPGMQLSSDGSGEITGTPSATGQFLFSVAATYRFQSTALVGTASKAFEISVVDAAGPLQVSFGGDLGIATVGDTIQRDLTNWVNKIATWTVDGGGGLVQIVNNKLIVPVTSAADISFNLIAQSLNGELVTVSTHLKVNAAAQTGASAPTINAINPSVPTASTDLQAIGVAGTGFTSGAMIEFKRPDGYVFPPRPVSEFATDQLKTDMNFGLVVGTWHLTVISGDSQRSNTLPFQVQPLSSGASAPTIVGVAPSPVPGVDGPQRFVVTGTGFNETANVTLRDVTNSETYPNRTISAFQPTSIELSPNFTNATASWTVEVINPDTKTSGEYAFNVHQQASQAAGPIVDSVLPSPIVAEAGAQSLTINGRNFGANASVILRDKTSGTIVTNHALDTITSAQITLTDVFSVAAHVWSVEIVNAGGQSSGEFAFTVQAAAAVPPPSINAVSPSSIPSDGNLHQLTITGSNFSTSGGDLRFTDPSGVAYNSTDHPERVVSVSATQWVYSINDSSTPGTWHVQVINADGQSSSSASFSVAAAAVPAPSISSVSPSSIPSDGNLHQLTIAGSNFSTSGGNLRFTDPSGVAYNSTDHPERVVSVSATQWVYNINDSSTPGTWHVQVINADGQSSSSASFSVQSLQ